MLGCDIVEISRVERSVARFGDRFLNRVLTEREKRLYNETGSKIQFVAGRFAAKEAVSKALGTGLGRGLAFTDIEIFPDAMGKPLINIKNGLGAGLEVSISHCREYAVAVCGGREAV